MRIPYGKSNFAALRRDGYFYVDKTPFLPVLESHEAGYGNLLFLRPRRIGKSLLLSMLEHYYDQARADQFDALFGGLWVHDHPTPERNSYLVLSLDFSPVMTEGGAETIQRGFLWAVKNGLIPFLLRYRERFPDFSRVEANLERYEDAASLIGTLSAIAGGLGQKLYLLIDEYDHFANRLLVDGELALYESIVRGSGFVRGFYAALKAATASGALGRMFITGVSPILLDDLSSGFNILTHISLQARFNSMVGFTRPDVERAVDELLAGQPSLRQDARLGDREALLATLERHYNGYLFSDEAKESIFNSDLVLYFLRELENNGRYPRQMLDLNVRTDYGRLQRLAQLSGAPGQELRALLETVLTEEKVSSPLVEQFGSRTMNGKEQLVSLFYYMGMLTFARQEPGKSAPDLVIPNRVMRELQWEYLALFLKDSEHVWMDTLDLERALLAMAAGGDIEPLLVQFREQVVARLGNKDLRQFNEKVLKLMLLAYISRSRTFRILSEKEFSGGYCDLFLGLNADVPGTRFAWMLEVKYLRTEASAAEIKRAVAQAQAQLDRYLSDSHLVALLTLGKEIRAGALVFVGARDILFRPWPREGRAAEAEKLRSRVAGKKVPVEKTAPVKRKPRSGERTRRRGT